MIDELAETPIPGLMGKQISIHRYNFNLFIPQGRRAALLFFLGLVLCSLLSLITLMTLPEVARNEPWKVLGYLFTPIIIWLVFAKTILNAIIRRRDQVILYERGFTFYLRGSQGFREWQDIESVSHAAKAHCDTFTITCQGKPDIIFDEGLSEVLALGHSIQAVVCQRLVESATRKIQTGAEVMFGPIALSFEGMRFELETVPWTEIEVVEVVRESRDISFESSAEIEVVVVREVGARQPWIVLPVSKVPNEFVLVDLAGHVLSSEPGLVREGTSAVSVREQEGL